MKSSPSPHILTLKVILIGRLIDVIEVLMIFSQVQGARGGAGRAGVQDGHREEVQGRPRYLLKWNKTCVAVSISFPSILVCILAILFCILLLCVYFACFVFVLLLEA